MVLEKITQPEDVKKLTAEELSILASEIRQMIIEVVARNEGTSPQTWAWWN